MHQIFYPSLKNVDQHITLKDKEELHHLRKVIRANVGDEVGLLNGQGFLAKAIINAIDQNQIQLSIQNIISNEPLKPQIHLYCAVPKKDRWEWVLEKGTEIGVTSITPLMTKNSDVRWGEKDWEKKSARQTKILISSAKQCSSIYLPILNKPISFTTYLKNLKDAEHVFMPALVPQAKPFKNLLNEKSKMTSFDVLIGPEGDFTQEEYALAVKKNISLVTLGPQILRVETAAITSVSFMRNILS